MTEPLDYTGHGFVAPSSPDGGTALGNSYLSTWAKCPRDWFYNYFYPSLGGDGLPYRGIAPLFTKPPFITGRIFHDALAAWYLSGCRDGEDTGEYQIDSCMDEGRRVWQAALDLGEYQGGIESAEQDWNLLEPMLRSYHDRFGPNSPNPDWPEIRVAHDANGEPIIEREFRAQLAPGYVYTCRVDGVVYHRGHLKVLEHKTVSPYGIRPRRASLSSDSQFTGEYWILQELFPEQQIAGVLVNMVIKNRSGNSKFDVAERETTTRSPGMIESWRLSSIAILRQIEEATSAYDAWPTDSQATRELRAQTLFPDNGTRTGQCFAYNSECPHLQLCQLAGMEHKALAGFRPRIKEETDALREAL